LPCERCVLAEQFNDLLLDFVRFDLGFFEEQLDCIDLVEILQNLVCFRDVADLSQQSARSAQDFQLLALVCDLLQNLFEVLLVSLQRVFDVVQNQKHFFVLQTVDYFIKVGLVYVAFFQLLLELFFVFHKHFLFLFFFQEIRRLLVQIL
jgi:hypothetical protein